MEKNMHASMTILLPANVTGSTEAHQVKPQVRGFDSKLYSPRPQALNCQVVSERSEPVKALSRSTK